MCIEFCHDKGERVWYNILQYSKHVHVESHHKGERVWPCLEVREVVAFHHKEVLGKKKKLIRI